MAVCIVCGTCGAEIAGEEEHHCAALDPDEPTKPGGAPTEPPAPSWAVPPPTAVRRGPS